MAKILIIEDEAQVVSFIRKGLSEEGFEVTVALDGISGLQLFHNNNFDLIILDIMLPGKNGLEVCRELRKSNKRIPVLFLTALGTSENIVMGLESGGDDYLVKPFKFVELLARIKSLLRRTGDSILQEDVDEHAKFKFGIADLELNDFTKTVKRSTNLISLTNTEYRLLLYFLKNQNKVMTRIDILEEVWSINFNLGTNVVDVYVNYLRKKIDKFSDRKLIHTIVGMGYVMKEE